jgi:hypothetical protein
MLLEGKIDFIITINVLLIRDKNSNKKYILSSSKKYGENFKKEFKKEITNWNNEKYSDYAFVNLIDGYLTKNNFLEEEE